MIRSLRSLTGPVGSSVASWDLVLLDHPEGRLHERVGQQGADEDLAVRVALCADPVLGARIVDEARVAAEEAVEADPSSGRVMATLAAIALKDPQASSPSQLENSLSVLVAQGEACAVLATAASERFPQSFVDRVDVYPYIRATTLRTSAAASRADAEEVDMPRPIRVGLIGVGWGSIVQVPAFRMLPEFD